MPAERKLRVACHGRNGHQIHHLLAAGYAQAELVAVSAFDDARLPAAVARHAGLAELLAAGGVDLVSLCSPRREHQAADALACLDAGCHVLAEKPAALSSAELERVVRRAGERGLVFREMAGICDHRPFPDLKRLLADGAIGAPFQITVQKSYPWHGERPADARVDGGVRLQVGVHVLRIAEQLLGPIVDLHSRSTHLGDPAARGLVMAAGFAWTHAGGAIGGGVANYGGAREIGVWGNDAVRVFGAEGHLAWSAVEGCIRVWRRGHLPEVRQPELDEIPHLDRVVAACLGDTGALAPLDAELHPTRLLLATQDGA